MIRVELVNVFRNSGWSKLLPWDCRPPSRIGMETLRFQMCALMAPHLPANIELTVSGFPAGRLRPLYFRRWLRSRRPAIFILLRHAVYGAIRMSDEELDALKRRAIAVGVDHKDGDPSALDLSKYDFHISASESGRHALEALLDEAPNQSGRRPATGVWYQSHDQRLERVRPESRDRLAPIYLGLSRHAAIPKSLSDQIPIIEVTYSEEMERAIDVLGRYNFHYAVRPSPKPTFRRPFKPFTKGLTAAACGSNVLVNRQVDDAVHFLTEDYPYLVASNAPGDVEGGFRKAKEDFGGPEWRRGLDIMRSVSDRVSGPVQARRFAELVTHLAS